MIASSRSGGWLVSRGCYGLNLTAFAILCVFFGAAPRVASILSAGLEGVLLLVVLGLSGRRAVTVRSGLASSAVVAGCFGAFSLLAMSSASLLLDQAGAALAGDLLGWLVMITPVPASLLMTGRARATVSTCSTP